jgi:glycosyltransferase involved in cell wall biosynthesis
MAIYWILLGSNNVASSRIHGRMIHEYLLNKRIRSRLLVDPPPGLSNYDIPWTDPFSMIRNGYIQKGDIVIFETVGGPMAQQFACQLREAGVFVINIECDLFLEKPIYQYSDLVICSSSYLAKLVAKMTKCPVRFIPDPIEKYLKEQDLAARIADRSQDLRLCWIGNYEHWNTLGEIKAVLSLPEFNDFSLITVSDHPEADIKWSHARAYRELLGCDVAVVPTARTERALSKSNNRVTQAMAMGAPVIAGMLPAYQEVIHHGINGLLCDTQQDWIEAFRQMRNPNCRKLFSRAGWEMVKEYYTISEIGERWMSVLDEFNLELGDNSNLRILPWKIKVQEYSRYIRMYQHEYFPIKKYFSKSISIFKEK